MIHKEGYAYIALSVVLAILGWVGINMGAGIVFWISIVVLGLGLFLLIFSLQFFRNPKRTIPKKDRNLVYTPADGKVVVIEKVFEPEYFKEERMQVSVFMSPLNVHVNRIPIEGEIAYTKYHEGKYLVAWHPKSSTENERSTTVIKSEKGEILMRQIAGALARRIKNYMQPGTKVEQGQEMGFIKFGSRVDLFLPLDAKIEVELDDVVKGNLDVIARLQ